MQCSANQNKGCSSMDSFRGFGGPATVSRLLLEPHGSYLLTNSDYEQHVTLVSFEFLNYRHISDSEIVATGSTPVLVSKKSNSLLPCPEHRKTALPFCVCALAPRTSRHKIGGQGVGRSRGLGHQAPDVAARSPWHAFQRGASEHLPEAQRAGLT